MAGQRWIRLDVDYFDNPKALAAGRDGRDLHLASICWVGRYLTDGHIPAAAIPTIARQAGVRENAADLVANAGLWVPNGDGFYLHDFTAMNGTKAEVNVKHEQYLERQRKYRAKQLAAIRDAESTER